MKKWVTGALVALCAGVLTTTVVTAYRQPAVSSSYVTVLGQSPYVIGY